MVALKAIVPRDSQDSSMPPVTSSLLIALLTLVLVSAVLAASLWFVQRRKQRNKAEQKLLQVEDAEKQAPNMSHHRRTSSITVTNGSFGQQSNLQSKSVFVYQEKQDLVDNSSSPPPSPLPEIRITFPEEVDSAGKRSSGRVVVVHVGEKGVGMEPVEDKLPSYQKDASDRFQSLDLERMGGLKEKN